MAVAVVGVVVVGAACVLSGVCEVAAAVGAGAEAAVTVAAEAEAAATVVAETEAAVTVVAESDTIVLGQYPGYLEMGEQIGARTFNVSADVWESMSAEEQWAANREFLDDAIARGSDIRLSTPIDDARVGSAFERELQYLRWKGYVPGADGSSMLPGGR